MNDVINRKDAIGAILSVGHIAELSDGDAVIRVSAVNYVLGNLPPAQPERQRGEWIEISSINHTYKCSECGRLLVNVADGRNNVSKHYPYCHCGADMRGEKDERTD
jgi:hypothetical protein